MTHPLTTETTIEEIIDKFSFLEDWEDRYGYLIELGNSLAPVDESQMNEANKVRGCVSQVWLLSHFEGGKLWFNGASDAHIVRGLVAVALVLFSGKTPSEIEATDEDATFHAIGLSEHLTPQRANGLKSLVAKIKATAENVKGSD
ncbi:MAG: SufE family protein [Rhizobiaceae bacterium]